MFHKIPLIFDVGISGTISAVLAVFLYTSSKRYFKIIGDNKFKSKGTSAIWFIIFTIIAGLSVTHLPNMIYHSFINPKVQSLGFILTSGWFCVNLMVDEWNIELPTDTDDFYELIILLGIIALISPYIVDKLF